MNLKGKRVFVGLSGGVDSGVTAALLQEQGATVIGVFIKGWYPPGMPCTWAEDRRDAMRVAAHLQIPFHTLDASLEYKQGVIDYLLAEYKAGRTPNPDIMCNREVKFGAFYRFAKEKGADYMATGHYARVENGMLMRGIDPAKDQSYFLWAVPKEALDLTLMPLGDKRKDETRRLAGKYGLPNAQKKDSQGICFLGSISVEDFLRSEFGEQERGSAKDAEGNIVGTHTGSLFHTLGSRVALEDAIPGPWYVVGKDMEKNELFVSKERVTKTHSLTLREQNWFMKPEGTVQAQFRYHGPILEGEYTNVFTPLGSLPEPIALGQSLVLYKDNTVIGGGIIA
ncbi:MAG TPA: tRNA 2-thiouridine(34) synthase MnmA [Candidatus Paceibacterota bacterium]|nr:tRNA 2-thiouridine(34) synthase MnmA [Candidatus Paceibacterota bacterium]